MNEQQRKVVEVAGAIVDVVRENMNGYLNAREWDATALEIWAALDLLRAFQHALQNGSVEVDEHGLLHIDALAVDWSGE